MNILDRLSSRRGTTSAEPNKQVARLCMENPAYLNKIVENLTSNDRRLQGDCAEVLAEVAKLKPQLTAKHIDGLLMMLDTENNRALWESLSAIASAAHLAPESIYPYRDKLLHLAKTGSVIVKDGALATLGKVAAHNPSYSKTIFSSLIQALADSKHKDIPRISEYIMPAAKTTGRNSEEMSLILRKSLPKITKKSARQRVNKLLRSLECIHGRQPSQEKP